MIECTQIPVLIESKQTIYLLTNVRDAHWKINLSAFLGEAYIVKKM